VTLYFVSHRGQELARNLLEGFAGVLMSDGWQAYRWWPRRLRCWAHLKRKAVGLTESFSPEAQIFGGGGTGPLEHLVGSGSSGP